MVGQEMAAHSAAECSVGEDTHVQILHCVCSCQSSRDAEMGAVRATQDLVPDWQSL